MHTISVLQSNFKFNIMKNALILIAFIISFGSFAQKTEEMQKRQKMERSRIANNLSAEEMAALRTKELTLQLDLNESQQQSIKALLTDQISNRKGKMQNRPQKGFRKDSTNVSSQDYYKMRSERLDHQIEFQNKMKTILTDTQFDTWKSMNQQRRNKNKKN